MPTICRAELQGWKHTTGFIVLYRKISRANALRKMTPTLPVAHLHYISFDFLYIGIMITFIDLSAFFFEWKIFLLVYSYP